MARRATCRVAEESIYTRSAVTIHSTLADEGYACNDALRTASQQETIETAQKRLLRERQQPEAAALTEDPATERPQSVDVTATASGVRPTLQRDKMMDALSKQVKELFEQLNRLQAGQGRQRARTREFTRWECGRRGHMKRNRPRLCGTGNCCPEANPHRYCPLN